MNLSRICLLLVLMVWKSSAQETLANEPVLTASQLDLLIEKTMPFPESTQLSIAIIDHGDIEFFGIIKENDSIEFIQNSKKIFEIGSLTKVFTSTLLAQFVIDKKLKLDDPISEYISIKTADKLTFKQLANHTSGLPRLPTNLNLMLADPSNPYKDYGEEELMSYLNSDIELAQIPGEKYAYSNLGAGLLGFLLAEYSDSTYQELLDKYIFEKYEMNHSSSNMSDVSLDIVSGQDAAGKITSNWDLNALVGAGGILSNVDDLSKFALAQFKLKNKALKLTREPTFRINDNMQIGLGWHLIDAKNGENWVWHNGATGGYTSSMGLNIKDKNGIIILSNVSAFNQNMGNIDELCFGLLQSFN